MTIHRDRFLASRGATLSQKASRAADLWLAKDYQSVDRWLSGSQKRLLAVFFVLSMHSKTIAVEFMYGIQRRREHFVLQRETTSDDIKSPEVV